MGLFVKITSNDTPPLIAVLCDSPDPLPVFGLTVNGERQIAVVPLYQSLYAAIHNKKNRVNRISFQVSRLHESEAAATAFLLDHDGEIPEYGTIEIRATSEDGTSIARWFTNSGVPSVSLVRRNNLTTVWRYELIAGQPLKTL